MSELKGAMIIGQSGGPSSVINASCYGAIKAGLDADCITKVYGAANGIVGVLNDRLYIMDEEDPEELAIMKYTPSSALGSCRYKIADPDEDETGRYARRGVVSFYTGFVHVARSYYKMTGKQAVFYPIYADKDRRTITIEKGIVFDPQAKFSEEKLRVASALEAAINRIASQ